MYTLATTANRKWLNETLVSVLYDIYSVREEFYLRVNHPAIPPNIAFGPLHVYPKSIYEVFIFPLLAMSPLSFLPFSFARSGNSATDSQPPGWPYSLSANVCPSYGVHISINTTWERPWVTFGRIPSEANEEFLFAYITAYWQWQRTLAFLDGVSDWVCVH